MDNQKETETPVSHYKEVPVFQNQEEDEEVPLPDALSLYVEHL